MIESSQHILVSLAEESASSSTAWDTPAWVIGIITLNLIITLLTAAVTILVGVTLHQQREAGVRQRETTESQRSELEKKIDDQTKNIDKIWKRLEFGESVFKELRGKDAEVAVQMERKTGRVYERLNTMFTTKDEHRDLAARVYAMELGMAKEITGIKAGIDRLTTDLGTIADELKQQRQDRTKQQQQQAANKVEQKS